MTFQRELYFSRIKFSPETALTENSLFEMQIAQLKNIPFENLDCLLEKQISLDLLNLQQKILNDNRGGYCFELNLLLYHALLDAGFRVRPLLSRVMYRGTGINPKTHIMLLVTLGNREYLVDAGFGGPGLFSPMPLELNREDQQVNGTFKLFADDEFGMILKKKNPDSSWQNVYAFTKDYVYPADLEMSNFYTSQLPDSHFRHNLIAGLFTDEGRYTLLNRKLNFLNYNGEMQTTEIDNENQLKQILTEKFKLNVPQNFNASRFF